jgi:hypothetical protein
MLTFVRALIRRRVATVCVVGLLTLGGYLAFLGWDQHKSLGSDGYLHGPYQPWQVVALVIVMAGAAVWTGRRHDQALGTVVATAVVTIAWSVDAATDRENDGLWPIGALGVAVGTALGFLLVSNLAARRTPRRTG